jgi:hypothetical protein
MHCPALSGYPGKKSSPRPGPGAGRGEGAGGPDGSGGRAPGRGRLGRGPTAASPAAGPGHRGARARDAAAIWEALSRRYPAPGDRVQGHAPRCHRRWPHGWASGQVQKSYAKGRVARGEVRASGGKAPLTQVWSWLGYTQITTRVGARHYGPRRLRNRRTRRPTLPLSKARRYQRWMRWRSVSLSNCCRAPSTTTRIRNVVSCCL